MGFGICKPIRPGTNSLWTEGWLYLIFKHLTLTIVSLLLLPSLETALGWKQQWTPLTKGRLREYWLDLTGLGKHMNLSGLTHCEPAGCTLLVLPCHIVTWERTVLCSISLDGSLVTRRQKPFCLMCSFRVVLMPCYANQGILRPGKLRLQLVLLFPTHLRPSVPLCKWILLPPSVPFSACCLLLCNYLVRSDAIFS